MQYPDAVFVSAVKGINIMALIDKVREKLTENVRETTIKLRPDDYKSLNEIYRNSEVKEVKYLKSGIRVRLRAGKKKLEYLKRFI